MHSPWPAIVFLSIQAAGRIVYCIRVDQTPLGRTIDLALAVTMLWAIWCLRP